MPQWILLPPLVHICIDLSNGSAVDDHNLARRGTVLRAYRLNSLNELGAFNNLATVSKSVLGAFEFCDMVNSQYCMLSVEMRCLDSGDEELRSIGVGTSVRHGQEIRSVVLEREVLVIEAGSIDRLSTCAVAVCEVTSLCKCQYKEAHRMLLSTNLNHETWDDATESVSTIPLIEEYRANIPVEA